MRIAWTTPGQHMQAAIVPRSRLCAFERKAGSRAAARQSPSPPSGARCTPRRRVHEAGLQRARRSHQRWRRAYFFSGSGLLCGLAGAPGAPAAFTGPPGVNGKVANIDFAWFCICSCICTNMFFDCSI